MVLSLPFVLALVGAGVGLLVGILIFGQVSDAISCPAGGTAETTATVVSGTAPTFQVAHYVFDSSNIGQNSGSFGSSANGKYFEFGSEVPFNAVVTGPTNLGTAVYQEGMSSLQDQGEIRFGTAPQWEFMTTGGLGSDLISINFWLKGDVDGGPEYPLIQTITGNPPGVGRNGMYWFTSGSTSFTFFRENNIYRGAHAYSLQPADDSNWHMLTLTYDKSLTTSWITMCLDGGSCQTKNRGVAFTGLGNTTGLIPLTVGSNKHSGGGIIENSFAIDDLTIWQGYLLTPSDITTLYNGGAGTTSGVVSEVITGGMGDVGSEQCEQAKDTAWTVIGIMPVALFFGLFALFSSFQRPT